MLGGFYEQEEGIGGAKAENLDAWLLPYHVTSIKSRGNQNVRCFVQVKNWWKASERPRKKKCDVFPDVGWRVKHRRNQDDRNVMPSRTHEASEKHRKQQERRFLMLIRSLEPGEKNQIQGNQEELLPKGFLERARSINKSRKAEL